jgi:hypothetical protein
MTVAMVIARKKFLVLRSRNETGDSGKVTREEFRPFPSLPEWTDKPLAYFLISAGNCSLIRAGDFYYNYIVPASESSAMRHTIISLMLAWILFSSVGLFFLSKVDYDHQ